MRPLKFSLPRFLPRSLACAALAAATLAGCGSSYDPSFSGRRRLQTSAPLINPKRDPSFLAYAVPETELHKFPATRSAEFAVHGIDVSKYQGNIDWEQVRDAGVSFAFIKATEGGDRVDSKFAYNWAAAKAAGVPRGAYHFVYWCRQPHEEIGNFASVVPNEPDALPPVLDVEPTPTSGSCKRTLYREEVLRDMKAMLEQMERHYCKKPIIYADIKFHREVLANGEFAEYPFWVRSVAAVPHERYPGRRWAFWQITATGRVAGISTPVDRNVFAGSHHQWQQLAQTGFRHRHHHHGATAVASAPAPQAPAAPAVTVAAAETQQIPAATTSVPAAAVPTAETPAMTSAPVPASRPRF